MVCFVVERGKGRTKGGSRRTKGGSRRTYGETFFFMYCFVFLKLV